MKLKQLFCRHKKLTAVGIYVKPEKYLNYSTSAINVFIACKCDKCGKEVEYYGGMLQHLRTTHEKEVNIDKVFNHELWGKWW